MIIYLLNQKIWPIHIRDVYMEIQWETYRQSSRFFNDGLNGLENSRRPSFVFHLGWTLLSSRVLTIRVRDDQKMSRDAVPSNITTAGCPLLMFIQMNKKISITRRHRQSIRINFFKKKKIQIDRQFFKTSSIESRKLFTTRLLNQQAPPSLPK